MYDIFNYRIRTRTKTRTKTRVKNRPRTRTRTRIKTRVRTITKHKTRARTRIRTEAKARYMARTKTVLTIGAILVPNECKNCRVLEMLFNVQRMGNNKRVLNISQGFAAVI